MSFCMDFFLLDGGMHFLGKTSKHTDFSSIRQMLEDEGFFLTCKEEDTDCSDGLSFQKTEITRIFQLATMLICVTSVRYRLYR